MLSDLVAELDLSEDVYKYVAILQSSSGSHLFSLIDESTMNIKLSKNALIKFFSISDIKRGNNLFGNLNNESIDLINAFTLKIYMGSSVYDAPVVGEYNTNDIFNLFSIDLDRIVQDQTAYSSPINDSVQIGNFNNVTLQNVKFATFNLREKLSRLINVSVSGEVRFTINYRLPSNATLADLYRLSGGLLDSSDTDIALFTRVSVREAQLDAIERAKNELKEFILINKQSGQSVVDPSMTSLLNTNISSQNLGRINGDFSISSPKSLTFVLQDGDSLFIPKRLETVSIFGEVLNPTTILHSEKVTYK